jgi:hypothetical protein
MSGLEAGFSYPGLVRDSIRLVLDEPATVQVRIDTDGPRKAEECGRRNEEWQERKRASGIHEEDSPHLIRKLPPLKTIHLQWLDTSYEPVWRDANLHIDLDKKRLYDAGGVPFFSRGHSESFGWIFALPVLAVLSPYLYVRARLYRADERKHGMSRHAIALMGKIAGQLDAETEALLREAFRNDWTHHRKMSRVLTFQEAAALLDACALTERRLEPIEGDSLRNELLQEFQWRDVDGDLVGHVHLVGGKLHYCRFLGSTFEEPETFMLIDHFLTASIVTEDEE